MARCHRSSHETQFLDALPFVHKNTHRCALIPPSEIWMSQWVQLRAVTCAVCPARNSYAGDLISEVIGPPPYCVLQPGTASGTSFSKLFPSAYRCRISACAKHRATSGWDARCGFKHQLWVFRPMSLLDFLSQPMERHRRSFPRGTGQYARTTIIAVTSERSYRTQERCELLQLPC
jgi:hypothetical protein